MGLLDTLFLRKCNERVSTYWGGFEACFVLSIFVYFQDQCLPGQGQRMQLLENA